MPSTNDISIPQLLASGKWENRFPTPVANALLRFSSSLEPVLSSTKEDTAGNLIGRNLLFGAAAAPTEMVSGLVFPTATAETSAVAAGEAMVWFDGTGFKQRIGSTTSDFGGAATAVFDADSNFLIGGATKPTALEKGFAWFLGVAPTANVADQVSLWVGDRTTGEAGLRLRSESGVLSHIGDRVGLGTLSPLGRVHSVVAGSNDLLIEDSTSTANQRIQCLRATAGELQLGILDDAGSTFTPAVRLGTDGRMTLGNVSYAPSAVDFCLRLSKETVGTSGGSAGIGVILDVNPSGASTMNSRGMELVARSETANAQNMTLGINGALLRGQHRGSGTLADARGAEIQAYKTGTGVVTTLTGVDLSVENQNATGTVPSGIGLRIRSFVTTGPITARWAILQEGASDTNAFAGNILLGGTTIPTSLAKGLAITNGTAPTASLTDGVVLWAGDRTAGESGLCVRSESGVLSLIGDRVGFGTLTPQAHLHVSSTSPTILQGNTAAAVDQKNRFFSCASGATVFGKFDDAFATPTFQAALRTDGHLVIGPASPHTVANATRLCVTDGSDPEAFSVALATQNTIGMFGNGAAYFVARDITGNIDAVFGTSNAGLVFMGALSAHVFQIRTNNVCRALLDQAGNLGMVNATSMPAVGTLANGLVLPTGTAATGTVAAGHMAIWFDGTNLRARIGTTDYTFTKT